jgi:hypothetical protein
MCCFAGGVDNQWANLVNTAGCQGLNLLTAQPSGMGVRLCKVLEDLRQLL